MIKDKELGLKVAQTPEEALWERVRRAREDTIKSFEESLIIEKAIMEMADKKLLEISKSLKKKEKDEKKCIHCHKDAPEGSICEDCHIAERG